MSDLGPSKGAHHITGNLIKHMSDEQGPSNTRPKNRCRGPFHLIIPQRSFFQKKSLFLLQKYTQNLFFFHLNRYCFILINEHVERNN